MKYSQWIGIGAALGIIVACFLPWTWHPDLQKYFTGFFSEQNVYGKPAKFFIGFAIFNIMFFAIPRIWAKRWNLLVSALILAFAIRCFIIYSGCYSTICPDKQPGLWLMLGFAILNLVMAMLPDLKLEQHRKQS
jgi:hypothetical protein